MRPKANKLYTIRLSFPSGNGRPGCNHGAQSRRLHVRSLPACAGTRIGIDFADLLPRRSRGCEPHWQHGIGNLWELNVIDVNRGRWPYIRLAGRTIHFTAKGTWICNDASHEESGPG